MPLWITRLYTVNNEWFINTATTKDGAMGKVALGLACKVQVGFSREHYVTGIKEYPTFPSKSLETVVDAIHKGLITPGIVATTIRGYRPVQGTIRVTGLKGLHFVARSEPHTSQYIVSAKDAKRATIAVSQGKGYYWRNLHTYSLIYKEKDFFALSLNIQHQALMSLTSKSRKTIMAALPKSLQDKLVALEEKNSAE
jgi:hypothetical protein